MLIKTVRHEFAEKKKRKRGSIFGEARWPNLGLLGREPGDVIYADPDLAAYGTFGERLVLKLIDAVNELREDQGHAHAIVEHATLGKLLNSFKGTIPFEDVEAFASFRLEDAWPLGTPAPLSRSEQLVHASQNTPPQRAPMGRTPLGNSPSLGNSTAESGKVSSGPCWQHPGW